MGKIRRNKSGRTTRTLVIAYISADNDLSPYTKQIVRRLRLGTQRNKDVTVIALVDQLGAGNTHLVIMSNGKRWTPRKLRKFVDFELDMASPHVLGKFLRYARKQIANERTVVVMIGHGTGPVPQCEWNPADVAPSEARPLSVGGFPVTPQDHPMTPQDHPMTPQDHPMTPQDHPMTPQDHPMTPQDHPMTPGDLSSRRTLSTVGLGIALRHATKNGQYPFDVLFMDQCFQGNLDVLYELRDMANVFVASPNYAWLRASYLRYLKVIAGAETAEEIASYLVVIYQETLTDQYPNAIFWVRGRDITPIAEAISALGLALQAVVAADQVKDIHRIEWAIKHSKFADTGRVTGRYQLGEGDELMGAASFAANLRLTFAEQADNGVYKAATTVLQTLLAVHGSHRVGNPTVAPDTIWDYDDTITILAPREREATNAHGDVWRASLYKPQDNLIATWGPDPTQTVRVTQNLAYVREGGWQAFINSWYRNPLLPTVGQPNYVRLHALVTGADVEMLALVVERLGDSAELSWSTSQQVAELSYSVFKRIGNLPWELLATVDTTVFTDPYSSIEATYRVMIFDAAGTAIADSNQILL